MLQYIANTLPFLTKLCSHTTDLFTEDYALTLLHRGFQHVVTAE